MFEDDDDAPETESVYLGRCPEHGVVVDNRDGTMSRLLPLEEGKPMPLDAHGIATVRPGSAPGTVRVKRYPLRSGPAKVASKKYRSGWDATFKKLDGSLN